MNKQKGQALVEFALIIPLFFMMCFAMIYGGMLFMDYLQFNNAARGVARAISVAEESNRSTLKDDFESHSGSYYNQLTKLYTATPNVVPESDKVTVTINLTLNEEGVPKILSLINFPPKKLKPIEIVMPLEDHKES